MSHQHAQEEGQPEDCSGFRAVVSQAWNTGTPALGEGEECPRTTCNPRIPS